MKCAEGADAGRAGSAMNSPIDAPDPIGRVSDKDATHVSPGPDNRRDDFGQLTKRLSVDRRQASSISDETIELRQLMQTERRLNVGHVMLCKPGSSAS